MVTDFLILYNQVRNDHEDELATFKFPNKSMFNTFSQFTKVRRREGFDELLRILITINPLPQLVSEFLELDEHLNFVKNSARPLHEGIITLDSDDAKENKRDEKVDSSGSRSNDNKDGRTKLKNGSNIVSQGTKIIFPSDESAVNSRIRSKVPSIFIQVGTPVIILYTGCLYFNTIEINESTVIRVILTCVTLILTFTFIKGSLEKGNIEKEGVMLKSKGDMDS